MSILAYYVHITDVQLQAVRERPALIWNINNDPRFAKAALFDVDKDYEVLAWLLSPKKKSEQVQQLARYRAIDRETASKANYNKEEFKLAVKEELTKLEAAEEDTTALATDAVLEAIEGRGTDAQRDPKINFGLGAARLFKPNEVKKLSAALQKVTDADLLKSFNRKTMEKFDVGGIAWLDEQDSVLDEILLPSFHKLRAFYSDAAKSGHYVIVIYQ